MSCRSATEPQWFGSGQVSAAGQWLAAALHQQPVQVAGSTRRCGAGSRAAGAAYIASEPPAWVKPAMDYARALSRYCSNKGSSGGSGLLHMLSYLHAAATT
jgi:hypothetical protein